MLIVYESYDEIIICDSKKSEKELLKEYFELGGRQLNNYDRSIWKNVVDIKNRLNISGLYESKED